MTCQCHSTWRDGDGEPLGTAFTSTCTCRSSPGSGSTSNSASRFWPNKQKRSIAYRLLVPEAHVATKIAALLDRPDSQPGQKDRLEIRRLLTQPGIAERTPAVIHAASRATQHSSSP